MNRVSLDGTWRLMSFTQGERRIGNKTFGNHYLAGHPPHSLDCYRQWLAAIADLEHTFDPNQMAR